MGSIDGDSIDITTPNGDLVAAKIEAGIANGKFTLADGTVKDFSIALAKDDAALFRTEFIIGEDQFVGGWIILDDGSVRGAIIKVGGGEMAAASFSGGGPRGQWTDPDPEP
jgi:hypothetical protein